MSIRRLCILIFLFLFLCCYSCAQQSVQPDFYQALKSTDKSDALKLFEKALDSSNTYIRQYAAEELGKLLYEGMELSETLSERVRREAAGSWAAAFDALGKAPDKEKVLSFLLGPGYAENAAALPDEAALYILRECRNEEAFFSIEESAAIEGRFAASRSRFREALTFFRIVIESGQTEAEGTAPHIFLQYPVLLNDLGRSFQYASSTNEGLELFLNWENAISEEQDADGNLRFRLLFFAARIARQRGLIDQGIALFKQALPLAPDSEQADACIWYILDSALNRSSGVFIQQLEELVHEWHDSAYFDDVLDRFSRALILGRDWKNLICTFSLIRDLEGGVSAARYAWVIARAAEEGYLSAEERQEAAKAVNSAAETLTADYLRAAYNKDSSLLYYRSLSAAALGEPFLVLARAAAEEASAAGDPAAGDLLAAEFLLGFFGNNAAEFSPRYIRLLEKKLSTAELRTIAEALAKAGLYAESIRLISLVIKNENAFYGRDMELFYPRPFREFVEQYSKETEMEPALLFALIRTESAFQSRVVSRAGAVGLTQLMPATAEETAGRIRRSGGPDYIQMEDNENVVDLENPAINIHIGAHYLAYLTERFENTQLALLAYNGGLNRVRRWRSASGLPVDLFVETIEITETREYSRKVMAATAVYRELYYRND